MSWMFGPKRWKTPIQFNLKADNNDNISHPKKIREREIF